MPRQAIHFTLGIVFFLMFPAPTSHAAEPTTRTIISIAPNEDVQGELRRLSAIVTTTRPPPGLMAQADKWTSASNPFVDFLSFRDMDKKDLLLQVILSEALDERPSERVVLMKRRLAFDLATRIPEQDLVTLIVPCYEKETSPPLKLHLRRVLNLIGVRNRESGLSQIPNYSSFDTYLAANRSNLPLTLIKYMYDTSPEGAIHAMARLHVDKRTADDVASAVKKTDKVLLQSYSQSEEWWKRLYVAAAIRKRSALRSAEILTRLENDPHPLVREAVGDLIKRKRAPSNE